MGFFDFLKDVGFEAPKEEPRRGTLIQTDNVGTEDRPINRIATMPTDRGSRIISRDEFGRLNTDQGRGRDDVAFYERGQSRIGVDPRQMDTQAFSTPGIASGMQGRKFFIGQSNVDQDAPNLGRSYSDMPMTPIKNPRGVMGYPTDFMRLGEDAEIVSPLMPPPSNPRRGIRSFGDPNISLPPEGGMMRIAERMKSGYEDAFYPKTGEDSLITDEEPIMYKPVDPRRFRRRPNQRVPEGKVEARYNPETGTYTFFDSTQQEAMSDVAGPEVSQFKYDTESDTYYPFNNPEFPATGNFGYRVDMDDAMFDPANRGVGEGRLGGNMVGIGKNVPSYTTQAYSGFQPNQGVTSREEGGIKDLNFLQKAMAVARNPIGRILGYETDAQGRLTMRGLADMEADKQKSLISNARNKFEADKNDRQRARAKAPFDPCEAGYTFDPSTQQCVLDVKEEEESKNFFERNPQTMQEYLNENRPAGVSGNVPLGMYGRVGGEYKYFMNQGGGTAPRGGTGEVTGAGGPKDDLVGPFMLSNKEYVLPNEQIKMYGGGNYETGVKRLEQDRLKSLSNFA